MNLHSLRHFYLRCLQGLHRKLDASPAYQRVHTLWQNFYLRCRKGLSRRLDASPAYQRALKLWQTQADVARTRDEYDFLPAYLEVIERPAAPWARRTAWALVNFLLLMLLWSILGQLDIHASAQGRVIISDYSKVIQPLEQGEIVAINVRDGQHVKAGEALIALNPVGIDAEARHLSQQRAVRLLEKARLEALLSEKPLEEFQPPADADPDLLETTQKLLQREVNEMQAELRRLNAELEVNQSSHQAGKSHIISQQQLLNNIGQRLQAIRKLASSQVIPRVQLLEQERELLNAQTELSRLQGQQEILLAQQQTLTENRHRYLAEKLRDYRERLNKVNETIAQLEQEIIKISERQRMQTLVAPVDGVVQQLAVHTLGGVVTAAQQLMVIVPEQAELEPLQLDVLVLNKDIGFILPGQQVETKIDSFPYTRYGTLSGTVKHISRDAIEDQKLGLVFPTRIALEKDQLMVDGKSVRLSAGMTVVAEIKTGKRRIIDYLLSPVREYQSEAWRER